MKPLEVGMVLKFNDSCVEKTNYCAPYRAKVYSIGQEGFWTVTVVPLAGNSMGELCAWLKNSYEGGYLVEDPSFVGEILHIEDCM